MIDKDVDGDGIPDLTEPYPADHELVEDPELLAGDDDEEFDFEFEIEEDE